LQTKVEIDEELNADILPTRKEAWPIFKDFFIPPLQLALIKAFPVIF
jgi:hypothetical protein